MFQWNSRPNNKYCIVLKDYWYLLFDAKFSFSVSLGGDINSANNETIRIKVKSGSVILGDTGLVTLPSITNKHYQIEIRFTIRSIGAAGVASIATFGQLTYSKNASNAFEGYDFSTINNTTFSTTTSNTLDITVQWGSTNASNAIYSESMILSKLF